MAELIARGHRPTLQEDGDETNLVQGTKRLTPASHRPNAPGEDEGTGVPMGKSQRAQATYRGRTSHSAGRCPVWRAAMCQSVVHSVENEEFRDSGRRTSRSVDPPAPMGQFVPPCYGDHSGNGGLGRPRLTDAAREKKTKRIVMREGGFFTHCRCTSGGRILTNVRCKPRVLNQVNVAP